MLNQDKKDLLNKYASLKLSSKAIENELDELNPMILQIMNEQNLEEIELSNYGKLSLGARRTWKYSPEVEQKDTELKELKKKEERTGEAEYKEKKYLLFKGIKEE